MNEGLGHQFKKILKKVQKPNPAGRLVRIRNIVLVPFCRHNLIKLAGLFYTDKWGSHRYAQHYQKHFHSLRLKRLNILEIGIGGYTLPNRGGNSLRMWKAYFRNSMVYGLDFYNKKPLEETRLKVYQGDQNDTLFLQKMVHEIGGLDVVIDDGSHINGHVIKAFEILFPLLNNGAVYVIEDTQTSYWPGFGGSSSELGDPQTVMGYFKRLLDCLNYEELVRPGYSPSYWDRNIVSIHFYHNLIFIYKGHNSEGSNFLRNNNTDLDWILKPSHLG